MIVDVVVGINDEFVYVDIMADLAKNLVESADTESQSEISDSQDLNQILLNAEVIQFSSKNLYYENSGKYDSYEKFKNSTTITEAKANGASLWDLKDYLKSFFLEVIS